MKTNLLAPINLLKISSFAKCPHCVISGTEFHDDGRNRKESVKLREEGKMKPLWVCKLDENAVGHRSCTLAEWANCPFH